MMSTVEHGLIGCDLFRSVLCESRFAGPLRMHCYCIWQTYHIAASKDEEFKMRQSSRQEDDVCTATDELWDCGSETDLPYLNCEVKKNTFEERRGHGG
jgi:hypothetical protein